MHDFMILYVGHLEIISLWSYIALPTLDKFNRTVNIFTLQISLLELGS